MSSIKVGPYAYEIQVTNAQNIDGFDNEKWGDCRSDRLTIRVHEQATGQIAMVTLMHELLHAIEFLMGQDMGEPIVRPLAPLLVALLEENGVDLTPFREVLEEARQ